MMPNSVGALGQNPFRVYEDCGGVTQGSSCLPPSHCYGAAIATLGWITEPLWGSSARLADQP
jgi:hypothetical protein